jgi:hypothetical protein
MKLLQTAVFVAAALLASTAARAESVDPRAQTLKEQLNLNDKQTKELDKLFKDTRAKQKALRKQLSDLYKNQEERINTVLTAEQKKKYEEMSNEPPPSESPQMSIPVTSGPPQPESVEPPAQPETTQPNPSK